MMSITIMTTAVIITSTSLVPDLVLMLSVPILWFTVPLRDFQRLHIASMPETLGDLQNVLLLTRLSDQLGHLLHRGAHRF